MCRIYTYSFSIMNIALPLFLKFINLNMHVIKSRNSRLVIRMHGQLYNINLNDTYTSDYVWCLVALSSQVQAVVGLIPSRFKPKTLKFVFDAFPLFIRYKGMKAKTGPIGVRVIHVCPDRMRCCAVGFYCVWKFVSTYRSITIIF